MKIKHKKSPICNSPSVGECTVFTDKGNEIWKKSHKKMGSQSFFGVVGKNSSCPNCMEATGQLKKEVTFEDDEVIQRVECFQCRKTFNEIYKRGRDFRKFEEYDE